MAKFDEKDYWRHRHRSLRGRHQSVGIDAVSERTNQIAYSLLLDRYEALLDHLDLSSGTSALDAGSGVGVFTRLLHDRGLDVTAVDISQDALDTIDIPVTKVCSPLADAPFAPRSFEYVHSFDVVYHIMSDLEWARSVQALATWSSRYVVMHERFLHLPQALPSKIMRMRPRSQTAAIMAASGFVEVLDHPTYLLSKQLLTYRLADLAPERLDHLERWCLDHWPDRLVGALASHRIKVFERR